MNSSPLTTKNLLTILDVSQRLAEQRMIQRLVEYAATTMFDLIPAERCMFIFFDDDGGLRVQLARTRAGTNIPSAADQVSSSILRQVQATLTPMLVDDALADSVLQAADSVRNLGLRSLLCVPLISHDRAIGVILAENRTAGGRFHEEDLVLLALFANQVVMALKNTKHYDTLEAQIAERTWALQQANIQLTTQAAALREQSIHDSLTSLYNRRYFNELLPQLFITARRYKRPLALAMIDIDSFKQINDMFFHAGGDRVLKQIGQILRDNVRKADCIARIGGEEFAVLMPETELAGGEQAGELLRRAVEGYDWRAIAPGLHVTISLGVAAEEGCADAQELLHQADQRLYHAKRGGKNRVVGG